MRTRKSKLQLLIAQQLLESAERHKKKGLFPSGPATALTSARLRINEMFSRRTLSLPASSVSTGQGQSESCLHTKSVMLSLSVCFISEAASSRTWRTASISSLTPATVRRSHVFQSCDCGSNRSTGRPAPIHSPQTFGPNLSRVRAVVHFVVSINLV